MEHARGKRSDWAPQLWWALVNAALYRRLSSVYLPTLGQRWLKVRKPTVILSTSAHRQLQTSILCVFADIGPTLAQSKKKKVFFPSHTTDMIVLVLYFSYKINIIIGTKFTEVSNIVISI